MGNVSSVLFIINTFILGTGCGISVYFIYKRYYKNKNNTDRFAVNNLVERIPTPEPIM